MQKNLVTSCFDHGSAKIANKTFGFLIVLDGATSHLTAYPCESTSPPETISNLHEWMDTFQMNPKAICADMAFHSPHEMQTFYRMHNVKTLPTRPHTPCQTELRWVYDCSKSFSWHSWTQLPRMWTLAQWMRNSAAVRNTQVTLSGETPMELAMGRRPRDLLDPASMNKEQLTSTPTEQDLPNKEIQKLAMRTHLEVQQREDIVEILLNG